jgi:tetraacyldisaccharide 4'-kinase
MNRLWESDSLMVRVGWRVLSSPFAALFWLFSRSWHALFDWGLRAVTRVDGLRVISVGNLEVGGTGKTPVIIALGKALHRRGLRVAILSRGYGRISRKPLNFDASELPAVDDCGDEPRMLARALPFARIFVDATRTRSAQQAKAMGYQVALLDDGFQHRRLFRDVDIVIVQPSSNSWLLPAGPRRETEGALSRATAVLCETAWGGFGPPAFRFRRKFLSVALGTGVLPLDWLKGRRLWAFAGIARPTRFFEVLRELGGELVGVQSFADHHRYTSQDLTRLRRNAEQASATLITTEKDAERLPADLGAAALTMSVEIENESELLSLML